MSTDLDQSDAIGVKSRVSKQSITKRDTRRMVYQNNALEFPRLMV